MIVYVPAPQAEAMSAALWALSRPPQVQETGDTSAMFSTVTALDAFRWLVVDTEFAIPVHAEAQLATIGEILQPYVEAGDLPPNTLAELAALIESKRGQSMTPWLFFPPFFKALAKTPAQMIADSLLTDPSLPHQ